MLESNLVYSILEIQRISTGSRSRDGINDESFRRTLISIDIVNNIQCRFKISNLNNKYE